MEAREEAFPARWIPMRFGITNRSVSVRWMPFRARPRTALFERRRDAERRSECRARLRTSTLTAFLEAADRFPPVAPAGLILHFSRSGAQAVGQALGRSQDVVWISDPIPVEQLLSDRSLARAPFFKDDLESMRRRLLDAVMTVYANYPMGRPAQVILRCGATSLLQIPLLRSIWPDVPILVVIRDPVEVAVSNLIKPSGWLRECSRQGTEAEFFAGQDSSGAQLSRVELCARVIGRYCESVLQHWDERMKIIDHSHINDAALGRVAAFFGIRTSPATRLLRLNAGWCTQVAAAEGTDIRGRIGRLSANDGLLRSTLDQWTRKPYRALRHMESWQ